MACWYDRMKNVAKEVGSKLKRVQRRWDGEYDGSVGQEDFCGKFMKKMW